ncbi:MAG: phospholipase D-like domain-containing protein [Nannocystaceae bacterium]
MLTSADPLVAIMELPRWVLEVGFVIYALAIAGFVVLERRRPTVTLALVLALIFVPVVGFLVYVLFMRRTRKRLRQRERRPINPVDETRGLARIAGVPDDLSEASVGLVHLALRSAAAPLRRGEAVDLLPTPQQAFDAFADAIDSATRSIHCEFYIWRDDDSARRITQMLAERAAEGIKVRVLYDHLGSLGLPRSHFDELREAGGSVAVFGRLKIPLRLGGVRFNFRNHRKILTVDGRLGFLGGINIGDEYLMNQTGPIPWRDLAVRVSGDAVIGLEAIFLEDWLASTGEVIDLEGERSTMPQRFDPRRPLPKDRPWQRRRAQRARERADAANPFSSTTETPAASLGPLMQVIASGPDLPLVSTISAQFSAAIASATRRVWLSTPYFVPDEPLMQVLRIAAMRGLDLRLLVPAPRHNDVRIIGWAARSYYDDVLSVGGRIFEYQRGMLHSKFLIVDDICAIGSANMDVRSFHINYEVTGMFYDPHVTASLAEIFCEDLDDAIEVTEKDRAEPSLGQRLLEGTARVLSPLL